MRSFLLVAALLAVSGGQAFLLPPPPSRHRAIDTRTCIGAPLPVPPSARASALPLLRAAAGDDGDNSSSASSSKKRRRKVPLPAELLEEQAQQAQEVSPSAPAPEPVRAKSREEELAERLKQDIARFKAVEKAGADDSQAATGGTAFEKAASVFEKVLVADFFVVLAFLGWFLTGVVFKSVLNDGSVLDGFTAIWMPVIQPALGILMAGTLGVGALNQLGKRGEGTGGR